MIDAHVHFWRYDPAAYPWISPEMTALRADRLPADFLAVAGESVKRCIAVQARLGTVENDFLIALAKDNPVIAGVVGWLDFCAPEVEEHIIRFQEESALCGFRHLVQDEPDPSAFLARTDFNTGITKLQKRAIAYDVLIQQKDLAAAVKFCARHDHAPLVIDHLAKPIFNDDAARSDWQKHFRALAKMEHVTVKLSGVFLEAGAGAAAETIYPYWADALDFFSAERCLWGSDWPVSLLGHDYSTLLSGWRGFASQLSPSEWEQVEGQTAARVYQLAGDKT